MKRHFTHTHRGFTLVELVITITVIGILTAIAVVSYNGIKQKAYDAKVDKALSDAEKIIKTYTLKNKLPRDKTKIANSYQLSDFLKSTGSINGDFDQQLKDNGPKTTWPINKVVMAWCGKDKFIVYAPVYDGVEFSTISRKLLNCQMSHCSYVGDTFCIATEPSSPNTKIRYREFTS